jgi:hypothetical protein
VEQSITAPPFTYPVSDLVKSFVFLCLTGADLFKNVYQSNKKHVIPRLFVDFVEIDVEHPSVLLTVVIYFV